MYCKSIPILAGLAMMASPAAAAQPPASKSRPQVQEKTYCFQYATDTGSRINRTECKTKTEWARLGVDVDELLAK
jgi:hypothetical protein